MSPALAKEQTRDEPVSTEPARPRPPSVGVLEGGRILAATGVLMVRADRSPYPVGRSPQLEAGLRSRKSNMKVQHITELLAAAY